MDGENWRELDPILFNIKIDILSHLLMKYPGTYLQLQYTSWPCKWEYSHLWFFSCMLCNECKSCNKKIVTKWSETHCCHHPLCIICSSILNHYMLLWRSTHAGPLSCLLLATVGTWAASGTRDFFSVTDSQAAVSVIASIVQRKRYMLLHVL